MNNTGAKKMIAVSAAVMLLSGALIARPRMQEPDDRMDRGEGTQNERMMERPSRDERSRRGAAAGGTMENSIMGDWVIRDTDKAVKVELDRDGDMELEWQQNLSASTEWEGFWTATDTEITFTVRSKKTKTWTNGTKKDTRESMNAVWKLQYTRTGDTLTLTGSDLPKELSGLTFYREGR